MFIQLKPRITEEQKSKLHSVGISCYKDDLMKLFTEFSKEHISMMNTKQIESLRNFKGENSSNAKELIIAGFIEKEHGFKLEEISRKAGVSLDVSSEWIISQVLADIKLNHLKIIAPANPKPGISKIKADNSKLKHNELADRYFGK